MPIDQTKPRRNRPTGRRPSARRPQISPYFERTGLTLPEKDPENRERRRNDLSTRQHCTTILLVILNNFGASDGDETVAPQIKLMRITFHDVSLPPNVATVNLADCRRAVLFHYDKESGIVEQRHYAIRGYPDGHFASC